MYTPFIMSRFFIEYRFANMKEKLFLERSLKKNTQRFGQGALLKVGEKTGLFLFISGTLAVHSYGRFWKKGD